MAANDRSTSHASIESEANKGDQHERKVGDYTIIQKIGQGSFATVYKAQHKAGLCTYRRCCQHSKSRLSVNAGSCSGDPPQCSVYVAT